MRVHGHLILRKIHELGFIHFDSHSGNFMYKFITGRASQDTRDAVITEPAAIKDSVMGELKTYVIDFGRTLYITHEGFEQWKAQKDGGYEQYAKKFTYVNEFNRTVVIGHRELMELDHYFLEK